MTVGTSRRHATIRASYSCPDSFARVLAVPKVSSNLRVRVGQVCAKGAPKALSLQPPDSTVAAIAEDDCHGVDTVLNCGCPAGDDDGDSDLGGLRNLA